MKYPKQKFILKKVNYVLLKKPRKRLSLDTHTHTYTHTPEFQNQVFRCLCYTVVRYSDLSCVGYLVLRCVHYSDVLIVFLHFEIAVNVKSLIYYSAKSSPCSLPWCATTPSLISPQTFITCLTIVSVIGKQTVKPNTIKLFWSLF